ncbi:hypothetical protein WS68_09880 [Burkholderia sp. TSV86]|nr:hypothetical protein WS68_09880 [Burkholderia sp. TSV86]
MFGHSFWLQPAAGRTEPILKYTGLEYSGSLAVYTFFLLSGVLVSASFDRQQSVARFIILRLVRIYPALIVCSFLTAYLIYPIVSHVGFMQAITASDTWRYFSTNALQLFSAQGTLPGLFEAAPLKSAVNASLWTLSMELKCYMLVLVAGVIGCFKSKLRLIVFCTLTLTAFAYLVANGASSPFFSSLTNKPTGYSFYAPPFFVLGMLLYTFRDYIRLSWPITIAMIFGYLVTRTSSYSVPLFYVAFVYILLWISITRILHYLAPRNDYSYGIYLWAFPIQQIIASQNPELDNFFSLMISIPATLLLAIASWYLIEKPAIAFFRTRYRTRPVRSTANEFTKR